MSKSIKRCIVIAVISISCAVLPGCVNSSSYHDGNGKVWIQEQVEKGNLTEAEAQELIKQED